MSIKTFTNDLAAVELAGVVRRYDGIPKELRPGDLPAQWVQMPIAILAPEEGLGTFAESGVRYTVIFRVAVSEVTEGLPARQRDAVLDMAETFQNWARDTHYTVETLDTEARIAVGSREYRGVTARITAWEME